MSVSSKKWPPPHQKEICSQKYVNTNGTVSFDQQCNELQNWPCERGYNRIMVRDQISTAKRFSKDELLNKTRR